MENFGVGGGLAALGLWIFIGMVVLGGIWDSIRKREAQHETLRRLLETGKPTDPELMEQLLGSERDKARDLRTGGIICLATAPGLVIFGWIMTGVAPVLLTVMLAVAALLVFIALGLLYAARDSRT